MGLSSIKVKGDAKMKLWAFEHHHHPTPWDGAPPWVHELRAMLGVVIDNQETIMISTSGILAAVAAERTELASWKVLATAQTKALADAAAALAAANAANDPAAQAQVQKDLDQAATDLSADNADAAAAIVANTPAATP